MPIRFTIRRLSTAAMLTLATSIAAGADEPPPETDPADAQSIIDTILREEQIDPQTHREFVEMLTAIARGSKMGPGEGWFHPGQSRYGWEWLAERFDADGNQAIGRDEFRGPETVFAGLDRDRSGTLSAEDFDWSDDAPFVRQQNEAYRLFRRMDREGDGRVSREDWDAFFARAAGPEGGMTVEDLQAALNPPPPKTQERPSREVLLEGLRKGEVGSRFEGPAVGETAPDFELTTLDGSQTIRLSDYRGKQPVVLVFGNFTCGPWRARFSAVEELYRRYGDEAAFLNVYVREAHPTDGWRMSSNEHAGVSFPQPQTDEERTAIARQCHRTLGITMPMLVDRIDDRVGNAYSGMPSRLYLIDRDGRVVYKSGRGPFGFKPGELEQSLLMLSLDEDRLD